mmetsp:Transcript_11086/g.30880  ORF Transcript_11086/g.30880 Transcript_11086/m.30880 type:complete len:208 (+) Transcript_11086:100-723(+)
MEDASGIPCRDRRCSAHSSGVNTVAQGISLFRRSRTAPMSGLPLVDDVEVSDDSDLSTMVTGTSTECPRLSGLFERRRSLPQPEAEARDGEMGSTGTLSTTSDAGNGTNEGAAEGATEGAWKEPAAERPPMDLCEVGCRKEGACAKQWGPRLLKAPGGSATDPGGRDMDPPAVGGRPLEGASEVAKDDEGCRPLPWKEGSSMLGTGP